MRSGFRKMVNQLIRYCSIGAGGFGGAVCRYYLSIIITSRYDQFPLETLAVNLLGSFALGFFITLTISHWDINPNLRLAIATGFWGSFTTYSTFAVGTVGLLNAGHYIIAVTYVLSSFIGSFVFTFTGIYWAECIERKTERMVDAD